MARNYNGKALLAQNERLWRKAYRCWNGGGTVKVVSERLKANAWWTYSDLAPKSTAFRPAGRRKGLRGICTWLGVSVVACRAAWGKVNHSQVQSTMLHLRNQAAPWYILPILSAAESGGGKQQNIYRVVAVELNPRSRDGERRWTIRDLIFKMFNACVIHAWMAQRKWVY